MINKIRTRCKITQKTQSFKVMLGSGVSEIGDETLEDAAHIGPHVVDGASRVHCVDEFQLRVVRQDRPRLLLVCLQAALESGQLVRTDGGAT